MTPAQALAISAAGSLLLLAAVYTAQRAADAAAPLVDDADEPAAPDWTDEVDAMLATARNAVIPTDAAELQPSAELLAMLKRSEALRLVRYRLGDGGWTNGYGHFWPDGGPVPPERITRDEAEAQFADDVEQRGARWVRTYVTVPLLQHEFDALTHIAFNLSPKSFRKVAEAVNAGQGPEDAALQFVRAGTNLEASLRARRDREFALFRQGIYA